MAAHRFTLTYPRYGTIDPIPKKPNGSDSALTPADPAKLKLYHLPVATTWYFEDGTDDPRIEVQLSFGDVPGPDLVNFDMTIDFCATRLVLPTTATASASRSIIWKIIPEMRISDWDNR